MKLAFENRRMRQIITCGAFLLGVLTAPIAAFAGDPIQQQPATKQQEPAQQADVQEFTKVIKKEFPINATGTVDLTNKYGKVEVRTWDRNRVKIEVTIVVDARSESSAQDVFDRINIDFASDDTFVKAETSIESNSKWWDGSIWSERKTEFQVNYEVYMPGSCNLRLENQYGDSNVGAISGNADIEVKYGNFQLEGVGGDLKVYLGYGNGTVVKARDISADVSYSKINIVDAQDINFDTKYSKIYIDRGAAIKAESRYDLFSLGKIHRFNVESRYGNVEIGDAETVVANSRYTDYKVERLRESADFDIEYGGLKLEGLSKGFSNVVLNGKYSDFKIYVEPEASFVLDGATNYAGIAYPSEMNVTYEKDKGTSHDVKGYVGTQNARSTIKANLNYGGLRVRYRE